jgi:hypothetical protein
MWRNAATRMEEERDRAIEERDNCIKGSKGLVSTNKEYAALNSELRTIMVMALYDRDRARDIAAMLENECANCWGPVHSMAINEARLQAGYPYPTGKDAQDGS